MRHRIVAVLCLPLMLAGCAVTYTAPSTPNPGVVLQGRVQGGQQPIAGAHVYLFAANTTGYGNASISLLSPVATGLFDAIGAYVLTDSGGGFSITGDYTCTANTQVYLLAIGGNPGAGINPAAGLLAVLGNCPGTSFPASTFISVNEVSTIAAAYSMAGFAVDATHVSSSGTTAAQTGIANAFAAAANITSLSSGAALATTPAGNGTVPQATINTLANILASCINSTGGSSTPCSTLFSSALSGGATGSLPTETATAAINIAHNPAANVAAIYGIATPAPPFNPTLTAQPNDFTLQITYTNDLDVPSDVAIDAEGNVWIANEEGIVSGSTSGSVSKLSSLGVPAAGSPFSSPGVNFPLGVTIDLNGNAWLNNVHSLSEFSPAGTSLPGSSYTAAGGAINAVAFDASGNFWLAESFQVAKLSPSGVEVAGSPFTGGNVNEPAGIRVDGAGNVWLSSSNSNSVQKLSSAGVFLSGDFGISGGGLSFPGGLAIDQSGNVWISNENDSVLSKLANDGSFLSTTGISGGGINHSFAVAIDGSGNVWTPNGAMTSAIAELSNSGASLSGPTGFQGPAIVQPRRIAIDGSGNVWTANFFSNSVVELLGAATPVVTPIAAGTKNNTLGTRP
jgi:streptogramin lyase